MDSNYIFLHNFTIVLLDVFPYNFVNPLGLLMEKSKEILSLINNIVLESCKTYTSSLELYWPGWHSNDASEKLFQQQVAIHLHKEGWLLYPEVTFGKNQRIDLVAIHKSKNILLCIESKRIYPSTIGEVLEDISKIKQFKINKKETSFQPKYKIGLILGSQWEGRKKITPAYVKEWDKKLEVGDRRSEHWKRIVSLSEKHEVVSGSVKVTEKLNKYSYQGWAKWIAFDTSIKAKK